MQQELPKAVNVWSLRKKADWSKMMERKREAVNVCLLRKKADQRKMTERR